MIAVIACQCGSSNSTARNFLQRVGYPDWLNIPIHQGKEKSLAIANQLPPTPEKEMLQTFLRNASKWVIVIGYDNTTCRWSNIARGGEKTRIEAEFVVKAFADS